MDLTAYVGIWCGMHVAVATATRCPELAITEAEGRDTLSAMQRVLRHYNIAASQKTLDFGALMIALGAVYAPRIGAIMTRRARPAPDGGPSGEAAAPDAGQVVWPTFRT